VQEDFLAPLYNHLANLENRFWRAIAKQQIFDGNGGIY
jgi:hypothetical protein